MPTIVKQSVFAVMPSSGANTSESADAVWECPMTHTPIATLRLAVAWPDSPKRPRDRDLHGSKATIFPLAVIAAVLLAAAGTFVGTSYLSGLLMQKTQLLQRRYEPRAQYSDVWNWQGRK